MAKRMTPYDKIGPQPLSDFPPASRVIQAPNIFDEKKYEVDFSYKRPEKIEDVHTIPDLVRLAENDENVEIEARILHMTPNGLKPQWYDKTKFIETFKNNKLTMTKFREASKKFKEFDPFLYDQDIDSQGANAGQVGNDFVPLLGGPFNKNMYYYDFLQQHMASFFAWNHDPIAKRIILTIVYFVLGKGFRMDVADAPDEATKEKALAIARAFEKVNHMQDLAKYMITELCIYGEMMPWELPNNETKIAFDIKPGQEPPEGMIPRWRLIDPSTIWDIVTYPEDITRVLYYMWIAPTQYQLYTGKDGGSEVPSLKFIMQQVPADQVLHFKINTVSNEKRGRSVLYPILGYLKRLRDSVNYAIIGEQKASAYCLDTAIEGSQADIDGYVAAQQSLGTVPPAGSEFVHTKKIERKYLGTDGGGKTHGNAFEWCLNMVAAGSGIPISYLGTHLSGGSTRASALVSTEPVAKMFEDFQQVMTNALTMIYDRLFEQFKMDVTVEITWPEIVTQDRSQKLKDLALAEQMKWLSNKHTGPIAAKEFDVSDYEYEAEQDEIKAEPPPPEAMPLSAPGAMGSGGQGPRKPTAVAGTQKADIKKSMGY